MHLSVNVNGAVSALHVLNIGSYCEQKFIIGSFEDVLLRCVGWVWGGVVGAYCFVWGPCV